MRFVDRFEALFFDMNGTFMFDHDRLGSGEDFFATYRKIGGHRLAAGDVQECVRRTCDALRRDYDDPACFDSFPSVLDAVTTHCGLHGADAQDIAPPMKSARCLRGRRARFRPSPPRTASRSSPMCGRRRKRGAMCLRRAACRKSSNTRRSRRPSAL